MPTVPTRLLLLIPHLGGGGAERVITLLARGLSREKYELHLGLMTESSVAADAVPPWVMVHPLGASRVRAGAIPLLQLVWRLKPKVILSGMFHLNFLVLLLRPLFPRGIRILVRQNGTVSSALAFGGRHRSRGLLYRRLYRHADRILCQTQAMAEDLCAQLGIETGKIAVLPNPVDRNEIRATDSNPSRWAGSSPHLLAIGRLSPEKGFDLLLEAFARLRVSLPTVNLTILGSGPEEVALKTQCRELGLTEAVRFPGYVDHPSTYFQGATLFVLSSRHEGLPNAMLEAAAAGLPIVATVASGGIEELLRDQPGCWLIPEITASSLCATLLAALDELESGQRFPHHFVDRFAAAQAIRAYEDLIDDCIRGACRKEMQS